MSAKVKLEEVTVPLPVFDLPIPVFQDTCEPCPRPECHGSVRIRFERIVPYMTTAGRYLGEYRFDGPFTCSQCGDLPDPPARPVLPAQRRKATARR